MKRTKYLLAVLLVLVFALAMSMPVFAVSGTPSDGSLTVTGDKEFINKTVKAYRIFTASWVDSNETNANNNVNDDNIDRDDTISYVLDSAWNSYFSTVPAIAADTSSNTLSQKAQEYVAGLNDAGTLALAKALKSYAEDHNISPTYTSSAATAQGNGASTTITGMTPGYYLVIPQGGSTDTVRETDATLVNVPSQASASWAIKSSYPTVEKTVDNGKKETDAQIGDILTFKLESHVPDMTEYRSTLTDYYTFTLNDTLSSGLTYKGNLSVRIGNYTLTAADPEASPAVAGDYDVIFDSTNNTLHVNIGRNVTIHNDTTNTDTVHRDLRELNMIQEGDLITVTYDAMLNENADIAGNGNKNTATVEYSTDPNNSTQTAYSQPSETKTYTYQITIDKHDNSNTPVPLAGAVFKLKDSSNNTIRLIPTGTADEYRVATAEEVAAVSNNQTVETVTTPNSGLIVIKGLAADTYKLEEVSAPTGYNKLGADIVIVVSASTTVNNGTEQEPVYETTYHYSTPEYTVDGTSQNNNSVISVVNTKGTVLPVTGGVGTIIFTVLGAGLVIFGIVFTSSKKKSKE